MALTDLMAALAADVQAKAEQELEAGRREAERIRRESDEAIARRRAELLSAHESATRRSLMEKAAEAESAVRGKLLAAREEVIRQVLTAVHSRLSSVQTGADYLAIVPEELREALSYVPDVDVEIRCSPALVTHLTRFTANRAIRIMADSGIVAGFRISAEGGRVQVDQTLETRLARLEPVVRMQIVRQLEQWDAAQHNGGGGAVG